MSKHVFRSLTSTVLFTRSKFNLMSNAVVILVVSLAFTLMVQAQVPQKFVSAKRGSDFTSCTINFPCRTFAAAMLRVPPRGEIVALDVGDYGPVTIAKAVTITGPVEGYAGINVTSGAAVTINTGSSDTVILRRLSLSGPVPNISPNTPTATGILFQAGEALSVENCVIDGFSGPGIDFENASQLFVRDTTVRNCRQSGILIGTTVGKTVGFIDRSQVQKNGEGIAVRGNAMVTVRDSAAAGSEGAGFTVRSSGPGTAAEMNLENCVATANRIGIFSTSGIAGGGALIRVSNSTITNNDTGVFDIEGGQILSRGNNTLEGNTNNGSFTGRFDAK